MKVRIAVLAMALVTIATFYKVLTPDINVQCHTYVGESPADWLRMCASPSIGQKLAFLWPHSLGKAKESCVQYVAWTVLPGIRISSETLCER